MNKKGGTAAILLFALAILALIKLREHNYLTLEQLNMHKHMLMTYTEQHFLSASCFFILSYIFFAALMLPGAFVLSLTGGLLFGITLGTLYITIGATVGAYFAFLTTRYLLGNQIQQQYGNALAKFNNAMKHYGPVYLFIVRLIPFFPFFLVNMLAGLTQVSSSTFLVTTALGILPLVIGFAFLGAQLRDTDTIEDFFSYPLAIAGALLLILTLLNTLAKKWRNHRT